MSFEEKVQTLEQLGMRASCHAYYAFLRTIVFSEHHSSSPAFPRFTRLVCNLIGMCTRAVPVHPDWFLASLCLHVRLYGAEYFVLPIQTLRRMVEIGGELGRHTFEMDDIFTATNYCLAVLLDQPGRPSPDETGAVLDALLWQKRLRGIPAGEVAAWICKQVGASFVKRIAWLVRYYHVRQSAGRLVYPIFEIVCTNRPDEKAASLVAIRKGLIGTLDDMFISEARTVVAWLAKNQPAACCKKGLVSIIFRRSGLLEASCPALSAMLGHMDAFDSERTRRYLADPHQPDQPHQPHQLGQASQPVKRMKLEPDV